MNEVIEILKQRGKKMKKIKQIVSKLYQSLPSVDWSAVFVLWLKVLHEFF